MNKFYKIIPAVMMAAMFTGNSNATTDLQDVAENDQQTAQEVMAAPAVEALQAELKILEEQNAHLKIDKEQSQQEMSQLKKQIDVIKNEKDQLISKFKEKTKEIPDEKDVQKENFERKVELETLQKISENPEIIKQLTQNKEIIDLENDRLKNDDQEAKKVQKQIEEKLEANEKAIQMASEQVEQSNKKLKDLQLENDRLKNDDQKAKKVQKQIEEKLEANEKAIQTASEQSNKKLKDLQLENARLKNDDQEDKNSKSSQKNVDELEIKNQPTTIRQTLA